VKGNEPLATKISVDQLQETVLGQVVEATSDLCLLEGLILPLIKQEKLWEHYPALMQGLWASVGSSFILGLCRVLEFDEDDRLGSLAHLLRRIQSGEGPSGELPRRWEAKRNEFRDAIPARLTNIKAVDGELAVLRSGYLAHLDMTKAGHPKTTIPLDDLKGYLASTTETLTDYFLAFRDESHSFVPSNYGHEPEQFLKWCRLDDYATHHAAWVQAETAASLKRHGLAP
jgi:hypothetical protein